MDYRAAVKELVYKHYAQMRMVRARGEKAMKAIPISVAKKIAEAYGYDQVIIIAREVGVGEHCTTYGRDKANCDAAAQIGNFLKYKVMGWEPEA